MSKLLASIAALAWMCGCSSTFCGAPCESGPKSHPPAPTEAVVNQYGTVFGHLEVEAMTPTQSQVEKNSLEALLILNDKDAEILKALKARKDEATAFNYDNYSTGGSRFNASGKLRRDAAVDDPIRKIPRMISESQNRELFERYRLVRLRILVATRAAAAAASAVASAHAAAGAAPPDSQPPPSDSLWSGSYRANGDTAVISREKFPALEACEKWGQVQSEPFRNKAFAFEFECRRNAEAVKRKIW